MRSFAGWVAAMRICWNWSKPCLSSMRAFCFFFFNDTATTEIYTLSLHDALPIFLVDHGNALPERIQRAAQRDGPADRKSTRLNSSHGYISYAVFCLKKKKVPAYPPTARAAARTDPGDRSDALHRGAPRRRTLVHN